MATEKISLPAEPNVGSQVKVNDVIYTRDKRTTAYSSLSVDGWRKEGDATALTWAELFVRGNGELWTVEPSPVRALVEQHVSDPVVVTKIVDALIASPHVDTEPGDGKARVGTVVTVDDYRRNPEAYEHVKSFKDKDGDSVVREIRGGAVKWRISFHGPSDASGLDVAPLSMWGPFTITETD